jgi:AcrR family transcriptional regulator
VRAARSEPAQPVTLREEQKLLTRRLFVEAAKRVFSERGYGAAAVDDIVKATRASRATFYLHFTSKAEVMAEIYESLMPGSAEYWRRLDRSLGSREDLRAWLEQAIHWWEEHRDILPALHEAAVVDREIATKQYTNLRRLSDELTGYFAAARGPKKRAEARLRIVLLITQLDEFCMKWVVQKTIEADREMVLDVLTKVWGDTLEIPETRKVQKIALLKGNAEVIRRRDARRQP